MIKIYQDFLLKNGLKFITNQEEITMLRKKLQLKNQLISDLCNFNDGYIVVKGNTFVTKKIWWFFGDDDFEAANNTVVNAIATTPANNNVFNEKKFVFKNNASLINCIWKINGVKIDNAEELDVVTPMYNLLEYSKN